jgi:hypothetical protein
MSELKYWLIKKLKGINMLIHTAIIHPVLFENRSIMPDTKANNSIKKLA